jgi:4-alpha-glucanotransferase
MKAAGMLYDAVRIDHFRALSSYWAGPAGAKTAQTGEWRKGPGLAFLRAMEKAAPGLQLIAEDLGLLDDAVRDLLRDSGLPGMKILQFAFSTAEESSYLPHNFVKGCVGYIGTHDNDTLQGWMGSAPADEVEHARQYLHITDDNNAHWDFIRGLYATVADLVVVQMQDVLGLPGTARMNKPGIATGNWGWRLLPDQVNPETARELREMAVLYGRCKPGKKQSL